MILLLKGFALGFAVAAPIGPVGLFCIRETLAGGRVRGLAAGAGAAVGDLVYGAVGALGVVGVASSLDGMGTALRFAGGGLLILLGIVSLFRPLKLGPEDRSAESLLEAMTGALLLTLASPMTIVSFAAAFAGFGADPTSATQAVMLVGGVALGSGTWWTILAFLTAWIGRAIGPQTLRWIGRAAGLSIIAFGVAVLLL